MHSTGYSLIGLQEMNLAYHYSKIYWNTSVLTIDAGANESNDSNKTTDYGKIASAIANIVHAGTEVALPDINTAEFGFKPDVENERIYFGLKGINGVGDKIVDEVIANRPYKSFNDFLQKVVFINDSVIKQSHVIQLIKAGAFDELEDETPREEIMNSYLNIVCEPKHNLNMQNFQALVGYGLIPEEYALEVRYFNYRKYIYSPKPLKVIRGKTRNGKDKTMDRHFVLDEMSTNFYLDHFDEDDVIGYQETNLIVSQKAFNKAYDVKMEKVKDFVTGNKELLSLLNRELFNVVAEKHASGSISKWEMESVSFYFHEHELARADRKLYDIVNFFELDEDPEPVSFSMYRGRKIPQFNVNRLVGTVLDRNKTKHTVSLLTSEGVVTVKMYGGAFGHYDRQISKTNSDGTKTVIERSCFRRGEHIMVTGYRRGGVFVPKTYKDSIFQHSITMIRGINEETGELTLQTERARVEDY